jgi:hypothetical protein
MKKNRKIAILVAAVALFSLPCQKKGGIEGLDLSVLFAARNLTDNLYVDMTYRWRTAANFRKFEGNRPVFVRFHRGDRLLLQDDYHPEIPSSEWEAGRDYEWTRKIFIPPFIDEFDPGFKGSEVLTLSVGLAETPGAPMEAGVVLLRKKLRVSLSPLTPAVLYMDGWYEAGPDPVDPGRKGRWTGREARCLIDNPERDAFLVIRGSLHPEAPPGQEITLRIDDTVLERFVTEERAFEKSYSIPQERLGDKKDFFLKIAVDRTFVPSRVLPDSRDTRELGVFVSFLYFK